MILNCVHHLGALLWRTKGGVKILKQQQFKKVQTFKMTLPISLIFKAQKQVVLSAAFFITHDYSMSGVPTDR